MTFAEWKPLYKHLCLALGRKENAEQAGAWFDALSDFPEFVIRDAVQAAVAKTWPPTHPNVADLRELATAIRRDRTVPASACDVCGGTKFTVTFCDGKYWGGERGDDHRPLLPFKPEAPYICNRDYEHRSHEDAHFCYQCHPAARRAS